MHKYKKYPVSLAHKLILFIVFNNKNTFTCKHKSKTAFCHSYLVFSFELLSNRGIFVTSGQSQTCRFLFWKCCQQLDSFKFHESNFEFSSWVKLCARTLIPFFLYSFFYIQGSHLHNVNNSNVLKQNMRSVLGPFVREGLLTESSCVCWLGEIFWHFPVDIKSEETQGGNGKQKKGGKGEREGERKKKHSKC